MNCRIVSRRIPVAAQAAQVYKLIENLENHRLIVPGASDWRGDSDCAIYMLRTGLGRKQVQTRITDRVPGMRIEEQSAGPHPCSFRRWFKIQTDEPGCIVEIAMECEMTSAQRFFLAPVLRAQIERMVLNIKSIAEKPKQPARPAPAATSA